MSRRRGKATGQDRDGMRGRHKRAASPEAKAWARDHLVPDRPAWMSRSTYRALCRLRGSL